MPKVNSGNSFKKGKSKNDLRRTTRNKNPRGNLLIVVEGETEKNYFEALKTELKIRTIKIEIFNAGGGSPKQVVLEARKLWDKNRGKFDDVFCVFDQDDKSKQYKEALIQAKYKGDKKFITMALPYIVC